MTNIKLSKEHISTFMGDIVTLRLLSVSDIANEDICWISEDENVCYVRDFKTQGTPNFSDGVLLVMLNEGETKVKAILGGICYTCSVVVRAPKKASKEDNLNYYFADFHSHTSQNHNREEFLKRCDNTPITVLNEVKSEGFFDCFTISDHADLVDNKEFFRVFLSAEEAQDSNFIVFSGTESEITDVEVDRHGYEHKNSGEVVTANTHGYANVKTWDEYFSLVYKNPLAICSFAHPQILGHGIKCIWNFSFQRKISSKMLEMFRLIEVGNGGDRLQNLIHERMYSVGLDAGLRLSPVSTSDWHGPNWGKTSLRGRTILMAPEKSKELFIDAIRNNRIYATENGNVKLSFTVNNETQGSTLIICENYKFHIKISHFSKPQKGEEPMLLEVISDYGKTIKSIWLSGHEDICLDFDIISNSARYFYLKITSKSGDRTWSSPIWTGRSADKMPKVDFEGNEINKSKWKVIECSNGNNPQNLIANGPENPWIGEDTKAEFIIDMGELTNLCAVGIYPHTVSRYDDTLPETEGVARFVSDYEIYLGDGNMKFELVSKDTIRCYGEEKIDEFDLRNARYIKIKILSTTGSSQYKEKYKNSPVMIGEIYAYEK